MGSGRLSLFSFFVFTSLLYISVRVDMEIMGLLGGVCEGVADRSSQRAT